MLKLSRIVRSLPPFWPALSALILGLSLAAGEVLAQPGRGRVVPTPQNRTQEEPEEEEPERLVGLLDPALAKPLMTLEEEKDFGARQLNNYTRALKSLSPSNEQQQLIEAGVRYRVHKMTIPEFWTDMSNLTRYLVQDLERFAGDATRAREHALKTAVKELETLIFSDQPTYVKINAAWLLGRLTIQNANLIAKTPAVPYVPAAEPMIKILADSQQRMDVKVAAVRGLSRILKDGDPQRELRDRIARAVTDQLNNIEDYVSGPGRDWYHLRLIDALGGLEFARTMTQDTFVVDALWKTMHNEELPWHLRTRAVRSLGQLKLDTTFNLHLLAYEIVFLTGKMTGAYNTNPNLSFWPQCFTDVYFAFKAEEARQQERGWGLLENPPGGARQIVEEAYQQVLPLVNAVISQDKPEKVDGTLLNATLQWLNANKPANMKIHQNAQPLMAKPAKPAGEDTNAAQPAAEDISGGA